MTTMTGSEESICAGPSTEQLHEGRDPLQFTISPSGGKLTLIDCTIDYHDGDTWVVDGKTANGTVYQIIYDSVMRKGTFIVVS